VLRGPSTGYRCCPLVPRRALPTGTQRARTLGLEEWGNPSTGGLAKLVVADPMFAVVRPSARGLPSTLPSSQRVCLRSCCVSRRQSAGSGAGGAAGLCGGAALAGEGPPRACALIFRRPKPRADTSLPGGGAGVVARQELYNDLARSLIPVSG